MRDVELILALLVMALIALMGRLVQKSWLAPAAFFALSWTFFVALSLSGPAFGVERYDVWPGALWWMDACLLLLGVGSILGTGLVPVARLKRQQPLALRELPFVRLQLVVFGLGGLLWAVLVPRLVVFGDHPPLHLQVLLGFHYIAPLLGGVAFVLSAERSVKLLAVSVLMPGFMFGLLDTGRTKIVIQLTYWFAGYFSTRVLLKPGPVRLFTPAHVAIGMASVLFFITIGVWFTPFRGVERELPVGEKLRQYPALMTAENWRTSWEWMHSSIFGHPAMFSWYFERAWASPPTVPKFPQQTAAGIYRIFGGIQPEPLYTEIGGVATNVFTVFKPPIEDFTLPGALVMFFACGLIAGWAYGRVRNGVMWPMALLMFYYANATILGGWFLSYNAITGAFVALGLYLYWVQRALAAGTAPLASTYPTRDRCHNVGLSRNVAIAGQARQSVSPRSHRRRRFVGGRSPE